MRRFPTRAEAGTILPNVPLDYLSELAPHVKERPPARCAYLQGSDGYASEARRPFSRAGRSSASN